MIYFVQPVNGGAIKIGCSKDVTNRKRELEFRYGCSLVLLKTIEGTPEDEKRIHRRFAKLRIGETEQFRPGPTITRFIGCPPHAGDYRCVEPMGPGSEGKTVVVPMRASREWMAWLARYAGSKRKDMAVVVRESLKASADADGFDKPPNE